MDKIKKIVSIIVVLSILLSTCIIAEAKGKLVTLKGVVYNSEITNVKDKNELKAKLTLETFEIDSGKLLFGGELQYDGIAYNLATGGNIYASQTHMLKNNTVTIPLESQGKFEFLSCTIEKKAKQELLLPVNKQLKESTIIKLAIKDIETNKIIYFEDTLPKTINYDILIANINTVEPEFKEEILFQETWFLPYLNNGIVEPLKDSDEIGIGADIITQEVTETNSIDAGAVNEIHNTGQITPFAVSPVVGISVDAFKTVGSYYYTSSDAYGYYRITNEWPIGTGNKLTQLIKWNTITNAPVPGGANGVSNLCIEVEAQYIYNQTYDTISLFDNNSYLRIKNPTVQLGLLTGNSDIIVRIEKNVTCNGTKLNITWKSWLGLVPYGSTFLKFYNLLTSVQFSQDTQTSNVLTFYDRISDSLAAWGKVHKDYKLNIPSDKYLGVEGDKVEISVGIKKPTDASNYYTYVTGTKNVGYQFDFDVYSRDGWGFYTIKEYTVSKDIYRTYK